MQIVLGNDWKIFLSNKRETCLIDLPLKDASRGVNVLLVMENVESLDICRLAATNTSHSKFFFWSTHLNPLGKLHTSNCYVFKDCDEKDQTTLKFPGYTYQRDEGERHSKTLLCSTCFID